MAWPRAAMKTYRAARAPGEPGDESGYESLQVRVEFQAERAPGGWRPPYWLRNIYPLAPSGFAWGYGGGGPTALALSLLEDALADLGEAELAELAGAEFVSDVIAHLDQDQGWELRQQEILDWFEGWQRRYPAGLAGIEGVLSRRVAWALRHSHPADQDLRGRIMRDLRRAPAVERLSDVWALSKLEAAAWVSAWLRSHPAEVEEGRRAWAEGSED